METRTRYQWFWAQLSFVAVGVVAFSGPLCVGSSSPRDTDSVEEQETLTSEVTFELYNDNLIVVKATVGPIKSMNLILDTGTSPSAITKGMADRLKLRGKTEPLQTLNGTIQTQSVILPRLRIGALHAESMRVVIQDLSFMERELGISLGGIAGLDILCTGSFTIDYVRKKIIFGPIETSEKTVRFETKVPYLTVKAKIEEQEVRLLVDSGTSGLLVYRNQLQTPSERLRLNPTASISTAGGMIHLRWFRAGVSLGKEKLGVRNVAIADVDSDPQFDFDGLLGFTKMGFRKVSFDFESGLFGWD